MNTQLSFLDFDAPGESIAPVKAVFYSETQPVFGPELPAQQAQVRDFAGGNQVVVAGAGTGKTEALVQRILKLLVIGDGGQNGAGPAELSSVVALTFTDKGAAEMRGRVYQRLVGIGRALPRGEMRARLETLRADFAPLSRISTFDAFSYRLLSRFPEKSPLPADVEVLDDATRAEMGLELARRFWNRAELSFSDPQKMGLWELLDEFSSRGALLLALGEMAEGESEENLKKLAVLPPRAAWAETFHREVERERNALWQRAIDAIDALELPAALRAELLNQDRIKQSGAKGILKQTGEWTNQFLGLWGSEMPAGIERVRTRLLEWRSGAAQERDEELEWRSRRLIAVLCGHALWWQDATRDWCKSRGVASYASISEAALQIIGDDEVAATLRAEISHLLIDEFQDTNWRQWKLLDALRDQNIGNILIVGDEKQAIFRFRGGDITVFEGVRKILLGERKADELTTSRRSTEQLVEWTNRVFRRVLPAPEARRSFEAPFQDLNSERAFAGNGLWQLQPQSWHSARENALVAGKLSTEDKNERAARTFARFARALCDDAEKWKNLAASGVAASGDLLSTDLPYLQFPDLREISAKIARGESAVGVIFTNHSFKTICENALRAQDVSFVSVSGKGFWLSDAVKIALQLLGWLLDCGDRAAFVGLARGDLGGLSDVALLEWHLACREREANRSAPENENGGGENGGGEIRAEFSGSEVGRTGESCASVAGFSPSRREDARAWQLLVARLEAWRELSRVAPFSEVLEVVLADSDLLFTLAGEDGGAQSEANWHKIIDITREREAAGQGDLRALFEAFGALVVAAERKDNEAQAPLPSDASIQLMTVWAAKGLGFPMTILAQLDGTPNIDKTALMRGDLDGERQMALRLSDTDEKLPKPWLWEKLGEAGKAEEEAQWKRLFYVAATRAESQLVLLWPEELPTGMMWANLCEDERGALRETLPPATDFDAAPRPKDADKAMPLLRVSPPLLRAAPREITLAEVAGAAAERFGARARTWLEGRLETLGGAPEEARQDVPFSGAAKDFGIANREWLIGAWEWIAPLPDGSILLLASGANGEIAEKRAALMRLAARNAGLQVRECWAVWAAGEETERKLVE